MPNMSMGQNMLFESSFNRFSRRAAVRAGALGLLGGLGMGDLARLKASPDTGSTLPTAGAKSVIYVFLSGGLAQHESFDAELPYCFIAVDLAEGPTMFSRLEAVPASQNAVLGCPVEAYFVAHTPDQKLPFFRLV